MSDETTLHERGLVFDVTGTHRLVLLYEEGPRRESAPKRRAFNFHSLVWQTKADDEWVERATITRDDSEESADSRRWIAGLHSIDPRRLSAFVKVGQHMPATPSGAVLVQYSWREWHLLKNREIRVAKICKDPADHFEPPPSSLR